VMMDNITFLWFLLFSMCESLHVAVKMYINYSFFTFITVMMLWMCYSTRFNCGHQWDIVGAWFGACPWRILAPCLAARSSKASGSQSRNRHHFLMIVLDQELISCSYSYRILLVGAISTKKPKAVVISNWIGINFGRNVLHVNTHQLTKSDFWFDVTVSKWRPWRHFIQEITVLPSGEWKRSICHAQIQQYPSVPDL